jgi:hypothetical protein
MFQKVHPCTKAACGISRLISQPTGLLPFLFTFVVWFQRLNHCASEIASIRSRYLSAEVFQNYYWQSNCNIAHVALRDSINAEYFFGGGEAFGVRQLAAAFAREASFAHLKRCQAAALQGLRR